MLPWVVAEVVQAVVARRLGSLDQPPDVVIVLGCPSRPEGRVSPTQRWRVDLALRANPAATLLFTGAKGEAEAMAADAQARYDLPEDRVLIEPLATTTWENVAHCGALLAANPELKDGSVAIASDQLHTARALGYWREQFPGRPVQAAGRHRLGEHPILTVRTAIYEVVLRLSGYRPPGSPRLARDHAGG
ncbi:MAG: YdcF family protein [Micropruina sp.]